MPYVTTDERVCLDHDIDQLVVTIAYKPNREGCVNYTISRIVSEVFAPSRPSEPWSYDQITKAVAAFECAKLEFYRRVAAPKEDAAILKNGDLPIYKRSV
jgi:hypothetical protein